MKQNRKNKGMQVAFEKVLKRYENGTNSRYICFNLDILKENDKISSKQYSDCQQVIYTALEDKISLEGWLVSYGHATEQEMFENNPPNFHQKLKQTRINWLKHLISQCKKNKF